MIGWHFREKQPDETVRNPVQGEHFSDEAIELPAQALVREAIQNSLDAARDSTCPVSVRFCLSGAEKALDADCARHWFGGAWGHLTARGNGLRGVPRTAGRCPFLVIEDFGTIGLNGDPAECDPPRDNTTNRFFSFFRAEGVSEKTGEQGGRWGIGKTVFPRSSDISSFFALTVRADDERQMLLGRSVLFYHYLENRCFAPDGFYGNLGSGQRLVMPIDDSAVIERFRSDFGLHRSATEPGLSVVVPYFDNDISTSDVMSAVIREYFYPILARKLTVRVRGPDLLSKIGDINDETVSEWAREQTHGSAAGLANVVELAVWARNVADSQFHVVGANVDISPPVWSDRNLSDDIASDVAEAYKKGEKLAFRVPLRVSRSGADAELTHFDVFVQVDVNERGYPPIFVRGGIRIPEVKKRIIKGHRLLALVIINDKPLATLLGDAETPAHTHWSHETRNFKGKYQHGKAILDFVSDAPRQLAELLSRRYEQQDRLLLADLFPRPPHDEGNPVGDDPVPDDGMKPEKPMPPPDKLPVPFQVSRIDGGFRVTASSPEAKCPPKAQIQVAYDRSRGNPLRRYHSSDFELSEMQRKLVGGRIGSMAANTIELEILDARTFVLEIVGFDAKRDVYVSVR